MFENTVMNRGFPDNLYFDLTDVEPGEKTPKDYFPTMMYLLYRLPTRTSEMILCRYRDGLSFRKIGELFEFSGARAEAIISENIEDLRRHRNLLMQGVEEAIKHRKEPVKPVIIPETPVEPVGFEDYSIAELNFTARTTHAFLNAGVATVADIIRRGNGIVDIPALGVKSLSEIVLKLAEIGVDVRKYFNRVIIAYRIDLKESKKAS